MRRNQEKIEQDIVELCLSHSKDLIIKYVLSIKVKGSPLWQPQNNILKAITKLNISSFDKEEVIDAVITLYDNRMKSYFTEIVSLSLEYGTDVQIPLLLKYGDIYEFVDGVSIISYLWNLKRFDLLDLLIEKYPSDINSIIHVIKYEDLENDEVISYLKSKATKPKRIDSKFEITEIHLVGENVTAYNLEVSNLESIKVNVVSLEEFVRTNDNFVKEMEVISKDEILDFINPIEFKDGWKNIPNNIIYFVVYFSDGKSREYKTPWVSDLWCGKDYIQRYIKKDNKYIWTYNTTMISNNYFSLYGLEEKIKSELSLPYDHKIKDEDLISFKEISLVIEEGSIFKNVEVIIDDLKKFVNLEKLELTLYGYGTKYEPTYYDIERLSELTNLTKITLKAEDEYVQPLGIEKLARKGLTVLVDTSTNVNNPYENLNEELLKKVYKEAQSKIIFN